MTTYSAAPKEKSSTAPTTTYSAAPKETSSAAEQAPRSLAMKAAARSAGLANSLVAAAGMVFVQVQQLTALRLHQSCQPAARAPQPNRMSQLRERNVAG
ncbi:MULTISPECIES: hypothetical protein [unclassified Streptomyces]|uniref:hypothetical protein n=1 Tax=unclassified Streptomyces TaxID=2593676 RepID=UPI0037004F3C